jgi:transposase
MERLENRTIEELHEQLGRTEGRVPTQRVLAAIGRKQGATLEELARRHGVTEKTIRNWLDRFAEQPLREAPYDGQRPGRPPKLQEQKREAFLDDLRRPPEVLGYEHEAWDPELVRHHLSEAYDVEYSRRHVYRLLDELGLLERKREYRF